MFVYAGDKTGGIWPRSTSCLGTVDLYTPLQSNQFDLFGHYSELHECCEQTKWWCFELLGLTLDVKPKVLPGLPLNWYVEVGVLEVYGCYSFLCLERGPHCFWCIEFFCLEEFVEIVEI